MIDTIKISIPKINPSWIYSPERFTPEFRQRTYYQISDTEKKSSLYTMHSNKFILRPVTNDEYQPQAEIYEKINVGNQTVEYTMKISFSTGKILFENNLMEISENSKNEIIDKLQIKLRKNGVFIEKDTLFNTNISKIHLGKNIILPNHIFMVNILSELSKTSLGKNYDATKTQHKNTSETFQHYCGSKDYAFYDKIRDILNKAGKSNDKEKTPYEKELVFTYGLENTSVFRFEYRLNRPEAIKSEVNSFYHREYNHIVTFNDLFNRDLWQRIITKAWDRIVQSPANQLALKFNGEEKDILKHMLMKARTEKNNGHSQNTALISFGLASLAQKYGIKFIKSEFEKIWSDKSCGKRLDEKIDEAEKLLKDLPFSVDINFVDSKIREFERLTGNNLENFI